jgi:hypothetical protein
MYQHQTFSQAALVGNVIYKGKVAVIFTFSVVRTISKLLLHSLQYKNELYSLSTAMKPNSLLCYQRCTSARALWATRSCQRHS